MSFRPSWSSGNESGNAASSAIGISFAGAAVLELMDFILLIQSRREKQVAQPRVQKSKVCWHFQNEGVGSVRSNAMCHQPDKQTKKPKKPSQNNNKKTPNKNSFPAPENRFLRVFWKGEWNARLPELERQEKLSKLVGFLLPISSKWFNGLWKAHGRVLAN